MLKGGIIGLGIKGKEYIELISQDPRTEITGIYDIDEDKVEELSEKHNLKGFSSSREMFKESDLDFVYIGLVLYCDHKDHPKDDYRSVHGEYQEEYGSICRTMARRDGWILHRDFTATCPLCNKRKPRKKGKG